MQAFLRVVGIGVKVAIANQLRELDVALHIVKGQLPGMPCHARETKAETGRGDAWDS